MPQPLRNPAVKLGALIRERRLERDMTQSDAARLADISVPTVRRVESGEAGRRPEARTLAALAVLVGIRPDEVRQLVTNETLANNIVRRMGLSAATISTDAASGRPDLLAVDQDGGVVMIEIKHVTQERTAELVDALRAVGFTVSQTI